MKNASRALMACAIGLAAASAQAQDAWSAAADFTADNSGTTSAWTYGTLGPYPTGTTFTRMRYYDPNCSSYFSGIVCHYDDSVHIRHNTFLAALAFGSAFYEPVQALTLVSGGNSKVVVRWTAPLTGTYVIAGQFQDLDTYPWTDLPPTTVSVMQNSSTLWSRPMHTSPFGKAAMFSLRVSVVQGHTITFAFAKGSWPYSQAVALKAGVLRVG